MLIRCYIILFVTYKWCESLIPKMYSWEILDLQWLLVSKLFFVGEGSEEEASNASGKESPSGLKAGRDTQSIPRLRGNICSWNSSKQSFGDYKSILHFRHFRKVVRDLARMVEGRHKTQQHRGVSLTCWVKATCWVSTAEFSQWRWQWLYAEIM